MHIEAVTTLENPAEFSDILREYLSPEIAALRERAGHDVDLEQLVRDTVGNIDAYLPPRGALWLVRDETGHLVATICLKMIRPDAAEIKRLYVRPAGRGAGLGKRLTETALQRAKDLGATRVLIDTGAWMDSALALYRGLGFVEIPRYPESENDPALEPHLVYMEKVLD